MATIKISRAKSCSAAIDYARGHDRLRESDKGWLIQNGVPIDTVDALDSRSVATSGILVDPDYAKSQMKQTRDLFQNTGSTEAMRVIQSFSHEDLDPTNPADWQRCNDLGNELAQKIAPNHQAAIYTHIDGNGHMLHNHIIINMPNLETGKKYNHNNDWERVCSIANQISREHALSVIKRGQAPVERRTMAERQLKAKNEYVWKDDLRSRIDKIMGDTAISSYKEFSERLAHSGIIIHDRGKNFSYEFLDVKKKHRRARGKTLGTDYEKETILNELELRQKPADPDISHLRKYSREAETSYLNAQQRSDRYGRDHQIATSPDTAIKQRERDAEQRKQSTAKSSQSIDRLTISIGRVRSTFNNIAEEIRRYLLKIAEHLTLQRLKAQLAKSQPDTAEIPKPVSSFPKALPPIKFTDEPILKEILSKTTAPTDKNTISELVMGTRGLNKIADHETLMNLSDKAQRYVYERLTNSQLNSIIHAYRTTQQNTNSLSEFQKSQHNLGLATTESNQRGHSLTSFTRMMDKSRQQPKPSFRSRHGLNR